MRKDASSSIGYLLIFGLFLIAGIIIAFLLYKGKVFTNQRSVDDTLTTACLATLVMDDDYYFVTKEQGNGVLRFKDKDKSYNKYNEVIMNAKADNEQFYQGLEMTDLIMYEVYPDRIDITSFNKDGTKTQSTGGLGTVYTPAGEEVKRTSCYCKIKLLVDGMNDISTETTKDCYCLMKFKEDHNV